MLNYPPDLPSFASLTKRASAESDIFSERSIFLGGVAIECICFGMNLVLYAAWYALWTRHPSGRRLGKGIALYTTIQIAAAAAKIGTTLRWYQLVLVIHADDSSFASKLNFGVNIANNTLFALGTVLSDLLIIYRCYIIWSKSLTIIILPSLILLASFALGILWLIQVVHNNLPGFSNIGSIYFGLSVALNVLVTFLVAGRILWIRYRLTKSLGREYCDRYSGVVAILVESAMLYTVVNVTFIVFLKTNSPGEQIMAPLLSQVQTMAPLLILIRVAMGLSINADSFPAHTSIRFAAPHVRPKTPGERETDIDIDIERGRSQRGISALQFITGESSENTLNSARTS